MWKWKSYAERGLSEKPACVVKATQEYFHESNPIDIFTSDCLDIVEPSESGSVGDPDAYNEEYITKNTELYSRYMAWHDGIKSKQAAYMTIYERF